MSETVRAKTANPRTANLASLLRALRRGPLTRGQLAGRTGLAPATVASLLAELTDHGLVRAAGTLPGGNGRPSRLVELCAERGYGLALGVEADGFTALTTDLAGKPLASRGRRVDVTGLAVAHAVDELGAVADGVCTGLDGPPVGVTVAVPGLVDAASQSVRSAPLLHWRDAELTDLLAARLGVPLGAVTVQNDANLGALAEAAEHPEIGELCFVHGGSNVGAGFVSGGTIRQGARGFAGEIAHISAGLPGEACRCGRTGCLQTKAAFEVLLRAAAPPPDALHDPMLGIEARANVLRDRIHGGDARAEAAAAELGIALGTAMRTVVELVDPQLLVLGGYFASLADWLIEPVRVALGGHGCQVSASSLGFSAALLGAATLATERLFADPALTTEVS